MFRLYADKNQLTVQEKELLTSGSVNACQAQFRFSEDWNGLTRTAVFRAGSEEVYVVPDSSGSCTIPWEVLTEPGRCLMAGVYGKRGDSLVLPTVWANLGMVLEGASVSEPSMPPAPDLWQQELARKGDRLGYTEEGGLGLYAGDELLSSIPMKQEETETVQFGHGLKVNGTVVSVDTANDFNGDNTLPITAAAVQESIGNIEALLGTI